MLLNKSKTMNYLPLLLLGYFVLANKKNNYKEILSSLSEDEICTLLGYLGIDENSSLLISQALPNLLSGEMDLQKIIPLALPLLTNLFNKSPQSNPYESYVEKGDLEDIKEVASEEISNQLKCYFSQ